MGIIDRTREVMLQTEIANLKKMLEITTEDIGKKCIDCREYVKSAVENCITGPDAAKRMQSMQEKLCTRCPLYPYVVEIERRDA